MEKPFLQLSTKSRLRIKVTPKQLREAADRLELELRNNTLKNQEAELDFSPSTTFYAEIEPVAKVYTSITSDDTRAANAEVSEETRPMIN